MGLIDWLVARLEGPLPPADPHEQDIARQAYADCLEAQLIGMGLPPDDALIVRLRGDEHGPPPFPVIMGVETQLVARMDDEQVVRNYWVVRDRLERVGAPAGIALHDRLLPPSAVTPVHPKPPTESTPADAQEPAVDAAALTIAASTREEDARHATAVALAADPTDAGDAPEALEPLEPASPADASSAEEER